jgi:hypothetical protein
MASRGKEIRETLLRRMHTSIHQSKLKRLGAIHRLKRMADVRLRRPIVLLD